MDTSNHHSMQTLFQQLGLEFTPKQIDDFIAKHKIDTTQALEKASFWNSSQATFLTEAIAEDSDWAEVVDHLSVQLRQN